MSPVREPLLNPARTTLADVLQETSAPGAGEVLPGGNYGAATGAAAGMVRIAWALMKAPVLAPACVSFRR